MISKQKSKILIVSIFIVLMSSCLTIGSSKVELTDNELKINDEVDVVIDKILVNKKSITVNGETYTPKHKSDVISEVSVTITNNSNESISSLIKNELELLIINDRDITKFSESSTPKNNSSIELEAMFGRNMSQNELKPGHSRKFVLYFTYSKNFKPAAIVASRINSLSFLSTDDPQQKILDKIISKSRSIENLFIQSQSASYSIISEMIVENELDLDVKNRFGINLLHLGLVYGNNSIIEGLIKDGIDTNLTTYWNGNKVKPIHLAVITKNKFAIDLLIESGEDINESAKGMDSPAVAAVRNNDVEALKLLNDYGVDIKNLMIPMAWGPEDEISILTFCVKNEYSKIVEYIKSL